MLEVYVNDNLTLMVRTRSTGRIGFVTTGEFKEVRLSRNAESVERLKLSMSVAETTYADIYTETYRLAVERHLKEAGKGPGQDEV